MAAPSRSDRSSRLVVTSPPSARGIVLELDGPHLTLGRNEGADLRLAEPTVSGVHALFEFDGRRMVVSDLDSSNGTTLNGARIGSHAVPLQDGDVLGFANVRARFEAVRRDDTRDWGAAAAAPVYGGGGHSIGRQDGDQINNVDGVQNNYVHHVIQQRESFLREVAATRTQARRLVWIGFALLVLGGGTYFLTVAKTASQISDVIASVPSDHADFEPEFPKIYGDEVGGVPLAFLGFGVGALGALLMVVGLVLHIVAASRRKRVEDAPPPWQMLPPQPPSQTPRSAW